MQKSKKENQKKLKKIQKKKQKLYNKKKKELLKLQKQEEKKRRQELNRKTNPKELKKIKARNKAIKTFSLIGAILVLVILFILSPVFYIKDIRVSGNSKISSNTILSLAGIPDNTNIFKVTENSLRKKIKENAYIDTVNIKRVLPSTLLIDVTERDAAYMLEFGSSFAYIDQKGYILEISKDALDGKVKIRGYATSEESIIPGNRICKEDLESLNVISQIMTSAENNGINDQITTVIIDKNDYSIYLESEGKTIEFGDTSNLETKMLYAKEILNRTKGESGVIHVNVDLNTKRAYFTKNT